MKGLSTALALALVHSIIGIACAAPTTAEFQNSLQTCAAGADLEIDADLIGSVVEIYEGDRTEGKARIRNQTTFLTLMPQKDRLRAYELYLACIKNVLSEEMEGSDRLGQCTLVRTAYEISTKLTGRCKKGGVTTFNWDGHDGRGEHYKIVIDAPNGYQLGRMCVDLTCIPTGHTGNGCAFVAEVKYQNISSRERNLSFFANSHSVTIEIGYELVQEVRTPEEVVEVEKQIERGRTFYFSVLDSWHNPLVRCVTRNGEFQFDPSLGPPVATMREVDRRHRVDPGASEYYYIVNFQE